MTDWERIVRACVRDARDAGLSQADAEDVAQEAALRCLEALPEHVATYARRIVRNLTAELLGGGRTRRGLTSTMASGEVPERSVDATQEQVAIERQAFWRLRVALTPSQYGHVVAGCDAFGAPRVYSSSTSRMARARIRERLMEAEWAPGGHPPRFKTGDEDREAGSPDAVPGLRGKVGDR